MRVWNPVIYKMYNKQYIIDFFVCAEEEVYIYSVQHPFAVDSALLVVTMGKASAAPAAVAPPTITYEQDAPDYWVPVKQQFLRRVKAKQSNVVSGSVVAAQNARDKQGPKSKKSKRQLAKVRHKAPALISASIPAQDDFLEPCYVMKCPALLPPSQERKQERADRPNLCSHFAAGRCTFGVDCRFSHDVTGYLDTRPADLPGPCPFDSLDACPYGERAKRAHESLGSFIGVNTRRRC